MITLPELEGLWNINRGVVECTFVGTGCSYYLEFVKIQKTDWHNSCFVLLSYNAAQKLLQYLHHFGDMSCEEDDDSAKQTK